MGAGEGGRKSEGTCSTKKVIVSIIPEATILAKTNDTRRIIINARLYAPSPLAMLISELRKHAMLLANSSRNNLTPIYYSVQPTLSGGGGKVSLTFCQDGRIS